MDEQVPASMDRHLDVLEMHPASGLLVGASSLTGRYWLGSLWFYASPEGAPDVNMCTAGVQLEAGLRDASWVDAQRILVGLDTGGLAIWQLQDEDKVFTMVTSANEHDDMVSSVSINSGKARLLSGSYDHTIKLWNLDLKSIHTYNAHSDVVWNLQCHPTEPDLFMSCSQDGKVVLWDIRTSKPASVIARGNAEFAPTCVQWQPNSKNVFAVGDEGGNVCIMDNRSVDKRVTYQPHTRFITRLAFSPERPSLLASTSEDCKVVVASVSNSAATPHYQSSEHTDFVTSVTWNSLNKFLTCSYDGKVLQHSVANAENLHVNGDITDVPPANTIN